MIGEGRIMTLKNIIEEAKQLSLPEQIELWRIMGDMIGPPPDERDEGLTPAQEADLDRRLEEYHAGKAQMRDGEEAFARLRDRR